MTDLIRREEAVKAIVAYLSEGDFDIQLRDELVAALRTLPAFEPAGPSEEAVAEATVERVRALPRWGFATGCFIEGKHGNYVNATDLDRALAPVASDPRIYPCDMCGTMRTKAEGGTTFTVCDTCWDKEHPPPVATAKWDGVERRDGKPNFAVFVTLEGVRIFARGPQRALHADTRKENR